MPDAVPPDTTLEVTRSFGAPRSRVYAAWMDPAALQHWYRMSENWAPSAAEVDLRVGGRYRIELRIPDRELFVEEGEFREIVPGERLVYTNALRGGTQGDHDGTLVTVLFQDTADGGCTVTVREEGFPSVRVRDLHASGWPGFLDQLSKLLT